MLRRQAGKKLVLAIAAISVFGFVVFDGQYLTGHKLQSKLGNHSRLFSSSSFNNVPAAAVENPLDRASDRHQLMVTTRTPAVTTTPYWQNVIYAQRRLHTLNECSGLRKGSVMRLTRFRNTSYCVVPKVGCTFWLNVFRFLHGDTGQTKVATPFDIPRMITHYGRMKSMRYFSTNTSFAPKHLVDDLRFMFVRDPYSRLWSAYVDKFLLIDYWRTEGKYIVQLRPKKDNFTMCARDISFKEFVEYVSTRKYPWTLNEHWKPILYLCSPCLFQPHIIGKIETFSKDSRYILQLMNVSWILDSYNHELHVYQEMDMLITYNFQVLKNSHYKNCSNSTDLSRRLWKTFQINGYIPVEMDFPDPGSAGINATQFQTLAHNAYKNRPLKSVAEWQKQRLQMMVDAFKDISSETLEKLKKIYKEDFELFDYDPKPDYLFGDRKKPAMNMTSL